LPHRRRARTTTYVALTHWPKGWRPNDSRTALERFIDGQRLEFLQTELPLRRTARTSQALMPHLRSCERYDEPETLPYSIHPVCPMSADGGQPCDRQDDGGIGDVVFRQLGCEGAVR